MSHVISTVLIGFLLGLIGGRLSEHVNNFAHIVGPSILILMGIYFVRQHYIHHHFHLQKEKIEKKTKNSIILALVVAMFFHPALK
jgi:purine-cytosine permease-like protein